MHAPRHNTLPPALLRAITESLSVDVRSIRKTREALTSPSCLLLFDGLRVEFATTAAAPAAGPSSAGASSTSSPPMTPAIAAASGSTSPAASAAASAAAADESAASTASSDSAASDKGGLRRHGEGSLASVTGGGNSAENCGGEGRLMPPPLSSLVETVRVLSIEADERYTTPPAG